MRLKVFFHDLPIKEVVVTEDRGADKEKDASSSHHIYSSVRRNTDLQETFNHLFTVDRNWCTESSSYWFKVSELRGPHELNEGF